MPSSHGHALPRLGQLAVIRNRPGLIRDVSSSAEQYTERQSHLVRVEDIHGWQYCEIETVV